MIRKVEVNYQIRILSRDVFGFAEHQENGTYGIGCKSMLKRNDDVLNRAAPTEEGKTTMTDISWFVRQYISNVIPEEILTEHNISRVPIEKAYIFKDLFL